MTNPPVHNRCRTTPISRCGVYGNWSKTLKWRTLWVAPVASTIHKVPRISTQAAGIKQQNAEQAAGFGPAQACSTSGRRAQASRGSKRCKRSDRRLSGEIAWRHQGPREGGPLAPISTPHIRASSPYGRASLPYGRVGVLRVVVVWRLAVRQAVARTSRERGRDKVQHT